MARRYFGTDGVRGVFGKDLTVDLVERLGAAAAAWAGGGEALVGRDTRASGPELQAALARGIGSAGGRALLGGVLPTAAVALLARDLGAVVSASHNPPEYNGVKLFDRHGRKPSEADEQRIEAMLGDSPSTVAGGSEGETVSGVADRYTELVTERFGADLTDLRIAVDCANGALSAIAPVVFRSLGARVTALADQPDGRNINVGCGATDLRLLQATVREGTFDLGVAFDGDGDRLLAVDARGEAVDGDSIVAILAFHLGVRMVAVTTMTNMGFHALMRERGIRVVTTDVGDRHVLEALRREGGELGGEQSGHVICLRDHVTGDGLAAALLLCAALGDRSLQEAAAAVPRYPQSRADVPVARKALTAGIRAEVDRLNAELGERGRVLVRPSGTEPIVRVLAEAETPTRADELCDTIATLVRRELG